MLFRANNECYKADQERDVGFKDTQRKRERERTERQRMTEMRAESPVKGYGEQE